MSFQLQHGTVPLSLRKGHRSRRRSPRLPQTSRPKKKKPAGARPSPSGSCYSLDRGSCAKLWDESQNLAISFGGFFRTAERLLRHLRDGSTIVSTISFEEIQTFTSSYLRDFWTMGFRAFEARENTNQKPFLPWLPSRIRGSVSAISFRKEVIQPQVPLRLPCYDLVPIAEFILGAWLLAVTSATSDAPHFRGLTGGVYKAQEHIHRGMLTRDY